MSWNYRSHADLAAGGWRFLKERACSGCGGVVLLYQAPKGYVLALERDFSRHRKKCPARDSASQTSLFEGPR